MLSGIRSDWSNSNHLALEMALHTEGNLAIHLGKQGVILADANILTWMHLRTALANDDAASRNDLVAKYLHAQSLGL